LEEFFKDSYTSPLTDTDFRVCGFTLPQVRGPEDTGFKLFTLKLQTLQVDDCQITPSPEYFNLHLVRSPGRKVLCPFRTTWRERMSTERKKEGKGTELGIGLGKNFLGQLRRPHPRGTCFILCGDIAYPLTYVFGIYDSYFFHQILLSLFLHDTRKYDISCLL
jgi:hypothetical protein